MMPVLHCVLALWVNRVAAEYTQLCGTVKTGIVCSKRSIASNLLTKVRFAKTLGYYYCDG